MRRSHGAGAMMCAALSAAALAISACRSNSNATGHAPDDAARGGDAAQQVDAPQQANPTLPSAPDAEDAMENDVKLPRVSQQPYEGPPVRVDVLPMESHPVQYAVQVLITVPTGGWTLALDEGHVIDGVAKVFLTLERPGQGEIVTQALVDHAERFVTTKPVEKAEVYIHLAQRGIQTLTTDYRRAK